jgi:DinB superfamily
VSPETHAARIDDLRAAFDRACGRFLARYDTTTPDGAVAVPLSGGWTAAQMAAHVAAVNRVLSAIVSGRIDRAAPSPDEFIERPWPDIAASLAGRLEAPASVTPPPTVTRADARDAFEASRALVLDTFAALDQTRARHVFTDPRTGPISLYQVGDWLTAHVARHNAQLKALLGR